MATMTRHERNYMKRANAAGFLFLAVHVPVLAVIAAWYGNSWLPALGVGVLLLAGPAAVLLADRESRMGAVALAVCAMGISALAIHATNGLIEAHFELFVLIALLAMFGRVAPVLVAGATIAVHHVVFWLWLPASVFNYKASFGIVLVHAFFVVLEVVPCCWIALQFGRALEAQGIVMDSLGGAAAQIAASAAEIAASSVQIADGASKQAAAIQETSAAALEMRKGARVSNEDAQSATLLVTESDGRFQETDGLLTEMVTAMGGIQTSSEKISRIVKEIDQIAFQTNILALNASVEAARAGSAGLGFAVVADEVRSLAQRSATAARDTATLIEESMGRSEAGMVVVTAVAAAIRSTTTDVARVKALVVKMRGGSGEQSRGSEQVSQALHGVEAITLANAAASEQTAAAAEELTAQARSIRGIVGRLAELAGGRELDSALVQD